MFYGVIRYQEFLKVFNKIFYERFPVGANRNDFTLYLVFGYISFFRLEELSIDDYKKLVSSQDPVKLNSFLSFVFNGDLLRQYVREEWMTLFDYSYIDEKIIGGAEKNLPQVAEILKRLELKATGKITT